MTRLILADNQAIFRAGAARVLALEDDIRLIAQCEDTAKLSAAVETHRGSIVLFASGLKLDMSAFLDRISSVGSRAILIAENNEEVPEAVSRLLHGVVYRSVAGNDSTLR